MTNELFFLFLQLVLIMTGGMVATKVNPLQTDKKLAEAILISSVFNTGKLESFRSMVNRKCPKKL